MPQRLELLSEDAYHSVKAWEKAEGGWFYLFQHIEGALSFGIRLRAIARRVGELVVHVMPVTFFQIVQRRERILLERVAIVFLQRRPI